MKYSEHVECMIAAGWIDRPSVTYCVYYHDGVTHVYDEIEWKGKKPPNKDQIIHKVKSKIYESVFSYEDLTYGVTGYIIDLEFWEKCQDCINKRKATCMHKGG